jgi:hypothetical protein
MIECSIICTVIIDKFLKVEKMIKKIFALLILILISTALFSNMRAPYRLEGYYSSHPLVAEINTNLILKGEELNIIFPKIILDKYSPHSEKSLSDVSATYFINNKSDKTISLPVSFMGVNVKNFYVKLNDQILEIKQEENKKLDVEFYKKFITQRFKWNNNGHINFINHLKYVVSTQTNTPHSDVTLEQILKIIDKLSDHDNEIVKRFIERYSNKLNVISFTLNLKSGENKLAVSYKQGLNFEERDSRYGSASLIKAIFNFDYLLYPALTWKAADDFKLKINVILPDIKEERAFIYKDRFYALKWESNISFTQNYNKEAKTVYLKSEFNKFPEDILSIVLRKGEQR